MKDPTVVEAVAASTRRTRNPSAMLRHPFRGSPEKPAVLCGDQVLCYEAPDRSADAYQVRDRRVVDERNGDTNYVGVIRGA
jgi:hypothetical protein